MQKSSAKTVIVGLGKTGLSCARYLHARHKRVTVIDSGYQWDPTWGDNPLEGLCQLDVRQAQWLAHDGWQQGTPDVLDVNQNGRLDALAGHANFVAGIVAQHCDAAITIWNHNGGFFPTSDNVPTEAAVCRSILMAHQETPAKVIVVGFAFASLDHFVHHMWDATKLGDTIVVVPAGNQDSNHWRYPGALNGRYPGRYPNIVTVASHDANDAMTKSDFSNFGPWVTCSAVGRDVKSTFLRVNMAVEDDEDTDYPQYDFTANAWAQWSGTSFSSPKVAGAICAELAESGGTAMAALETVLGTGDPDPEEDLGVRLAL